MKGSNEQALKFFNRQQLKVFFNPEKGILLLALLFFGFSFWPPQQVFCQNIGYKYIKNYSPEEYDSHSQNWSILQDRRGIIYVANHTGLLEFDGSTWRKIRIPNNLVRSLAIDDNGTIYVGGRSEIGFLAPDLKGTLQYKSLQDHIDKDNRDFNIVWKTHAAKDGIYFATYEFLFHWNSKEKKMRVERPDTRFYNSFMCQGELFIRDGEVGLKKMKDGSLKLIPSGEEFAEKKLAMMVPYSQHIPYDPDRSAGTAIKILIGTRYDGFYLYDGTTIKPFHTDIDIEMKRYQLLHGIRLSSGDFALAILPGGVVIIDSNGRLKHKFTRAYGLRDDDVKHVFEDSHGNLWLGLNKGLAKIEYGSPISTYDERSDLHGIVLSVTRHGPDNDLYTGTSSGLYVLSTSDRFQRISDISNMCWWLLSVGDSLLAATAGGVYQIENNGQMSQVIKAPSYVLHRSQKYEDFIYVGTRNKLLSLKREKENGKWKWTEGDKFENIEEEIRTIVEDENGNLWMGTLTKGVLKVDFTAMKHPDPAVTPIRYNTSHDLPPGEVHVFKAAGRVLFGSGSGLYRFNGKNGFLADYTLGNEFAAGSQEVFQLAEDKDKNIWFHSKKKNFQAIPGPNGSFEVHSKPFLSFPLAQVNSIYPDPDGRIIWFARHDGLIRYDTRIKKDDQHDFPALIQKVLVNERLIFDEYKCKIKIDKKTKRQYPLILYKDRNLRFECAAPFFEGEAMTTYQYFLQGYDRKWSDWTSETKKDYTNLDSGRYTFQVQAKNVYETLSHKAVFTFKILPPWFKTWWAFLIYASFAFLIVYFIVKWRSWRLHQEKQRLEQVVKERTKEINQKNRQLEKQTVQLQEQSEKLKELDHVKSRFFANISHEFRTPLTLIMGPLEQMLSDDDEKQPDRKDRVKLMLRNSQRLLNLINQLLDLSKLDSGKMKLQAARQNIVLFLKGLMDSFHFLATQNKLDLTFHTEEEDITLYFDAEKLEKVICNLLSNAIKFTPPGGKITIKVKCTAAPTENFPSGYTAISVADTGVGIPREQLDQIFDRFYQAEVAGEHEQKGSGIGLALTKELVTLHHGEIEVKSSDGAEGKNSGTEFMLRLPLGKEHLKAEEIVDLSGMPSQRQKPYQVPRLYAGEEEEEGDLKEKDIDFETQEKEIILVVEDSRDVRKYIRGPLETHYTVVEAVNGKEGIAKAREIIPDLIISDIMMPEADGYELCSVLKQDVLTSHIPIVLLTAKASEENVVQGLETGADDYITKPFNTKILMARIRNLIELRRQLQQKMKRQMMLQPAEISVSSIDEEFLKELQGAIEKNLSDPEFTVEELGKKLYMSRASLYRKIQALTGASPNHFIRNYRLKRAAQLLKENFGNVTEIAFEVGFSSSAYFTKCFKEQFQQLPSSYQASEVS
ncbi:MAG: response regulator [Candidatus Aminicenantes bacterium]|jgi:signal transduction histidine kinase/DNA-binding response OmpR family regulator/ligand-binding sensor domain-containing protein